jgi:hypothetical protein
MNAVSNNPQTNETCPAELPNWCAQRHWAIFWVIIVCAAATVGGRIMTVRNYSADGDPAFFSANDRSRWATVRALGDDGTYQIDDVTRRRSTSEIDELTAKERQSGTYNEYYKIRWDTIDQVRHVSDDGEFHFYSSKPTLLPTILSGGYVAIKKVSGLTMERDSVAIIRILLLILNGGGWLAFLYFLAKTINSVPVRDWSRYYVLACGGFGTFLSTFAVVLNNHLPAAVSVMIALYMLTLIWRKPESSWLVYAAAGLFAAFAFANELPAASFFAAALGIATIKSFKKTLLCFLPAATLIVAASLGTNFLAHGTLKLAYMHRSDGNTVETVSGEFWQKLDDHKLPPEILASAKRHFDLAAPTVESDGWPSTPDDIKRWVVRDAVGPDQFAITNQSASNEYDIRVWNNWYDYPNSYWSKLNHGNKSHVDRGQPDRMVYAFHVLFGHHGIFSLTPIWIFSLAGMFAMLFGYKFGGRFQMKWLGGLAILLSVVVIGFYLRRPAVDCNYGGVTSGLRWAFWLIPFWLVTMLPVVDWLAKTNFGKFVCYALLAISILSASYSAYNPWVNPWLYEVWDLTGIVK